MAPGNPARLVPGDIGVDLGPVARPTGAPEMVIARRRTVPTVIARVAMATAPQVPGPPAAGNDQTPAGGTAVRASERPRNLRQQTRSVCCHCGVKLFQSRRAHWAVRRTAPQESCFGGYSVRETPGPIPNPEAKLHCADGTAPARVWESRTPPDILPQRGGRLRLSQVTSPFAYSGHDCDRFTTIAIDRVHPLLIVETATMPSTSTSLRPLGDRS